MLRVPLEGEYAELSPRTAAIAPPDSGGATMRVRWGDSILSARNELEHTCFEVLGQPLDRSARPAAGDGDEGRFVVCQLGYREPGLFAPGRDITVVGTVVGVEVRRVGAYEYRYPRLAADTIYLWPLRGWEPVIYAHELFPYSHAYVLSYNNNYYSPSVDAVGQLDRPAFCRESFAVRRIIPWLSVQVRQRPPNRFSTQSTRSNCSQPPTAGSRTLTRNPPPGRSSRSSSPRCRRRMSATMVSPRPEPPSSKLRA